MYKYPTIIIKIANQESQIRNQLSRTLQIFVLKFSGTDHEYLSIQILHCKLFIKHVFFCSFFCSFLLWNKSGPTDELDDVILFCC